MTILLMQFSDVVRGGLSIQLVGLLWLSFFLIPIGWAAHWIVRTLLARRNGYVYQPQMVGSGMFRWLS